jgi:hypothetical protein
VAIEKLKTYEECENKKNIYDLCWEKLAMLQTKVLSLWWSQII